MAWPDDIDVIDAAGTTRALPTPNINGRASEAESKPIAVDEETKAVFDNLLLAFGEVQVSPTANTLLERVKALLTGIVLAAGDNNIGNVDVASSALPEGAATAANQDAANTHLDDIRTAVESEDPVLVDLGQDQYETVAAGQTDQMCGATGAAGDYLAGLLIIPATLSPGAVSVEDGSTNIPVFVGGGNSVLTLHPFFVPLGIKSVAGGWEITTGTNVSAIAVGKFT